MRIFVYICMVLFFFSCDADHGIITSPIEDDFSAIENPKERWEAYGLSSYQIVQRRSCECLGLEYTAIVINDSIQKVNYEAEKSDEYDEFTSKNAITINQAFALIKEYKGRADNISVDYHPRYGYPTKLIIDIEEMMADEEIIYRLSDLKKVED